MDQHVKYFAVLMIIYSLVGLLAGTGALIYAGGIFGLIDATYYTGFGPVFTGLLLLNLVLAIPTAAAAFQLLQFREPARRFLIMISAINILNFPIGPLLGAYGLWVLMTPETDPLFLDPLPHRRAVAARKRKATPQQPKAKSSSVISKADLQP